jgi:hypothetical protein
VNGDIRLFTDSTLEPGARLTLRAGSDEGGVLSVREGSVRIDAGSDTDGPPTDPLEPGTTVVVPVATEERDVHVRAEERSRVIRVVHGPGHGFVHHEVPRYPRRSARSPSE